MLPFRGIGIKPPAFISSISACEKVVGVLASSVSYVVARSGHGSFYTPKPFAPRESLAVYPTPLGLPIITNAAQLQDRSRANLGPFVGVEIKPSARLFSNLFEVSSAEPPI